MNAGDGAARAGSIGPFGDLDDLREMPCLFCGVHEETLRFREEPFRVVACSRCGLVYVNPRLSPERLHDMYQEAYWTSDRACEFGYTEYLAEAPLYLRTYRLRREVILRRKPGPGRVLDVGCAAGFFLKVMVELGWETTGVELSAPMVEYATKELGLADIRRGDMLSLDLPADHWDVVTLWDVIEHLEDPIAHLRAAARVLKPDGLMVIETQNVGSLFARLLGRKWQHYKHAEHLYHFDPHSLERLLDLAGLERVHSSPRHGGKYVSMAFLSERVGRIHPVLSTLAAPLRLLGQRAFYLNFMDEMVVLARRR
ncbi:MAG: class I SAM-dependent methyltransferase [Planctomycetota bacterium]